MRRLGPSRPSAYSNTGRVAASLHGAPVFGRSQAFESGLIQQTQLHAGSHPDERLWGAAVDGVNRVVEFPGDDHIISGDRTGWSTSAHDHNRGSRRAFPDRHHP